MAAVAAATIALGASVALARDQPEASVPTTVAAPDPATTSTVTIRPTTTRPSTTTTTSEPPNTGPTTTRRPTTTQGDPTVTSPDPVPDETIGTPPAPTIQATELIGSWQSGNGDQLYVPDLDAASNPTTGTAPVQVDLANGTSCTGRIDYTDIGDTVDHFTFVDCPGDPGTASAEVDVADTSMVLSNCNLALFDGGCPAFVTSQAGEGGG